MAVACDTEGELVRLAAANGRPLLAKIDPYGDLVLTSSEVDQLVAELRSVDGAASWVAARIVGEVAGPAERCTADATTELHLIGD